MPGDPILGTQGVQLSVAEEVDAMRRRIASLREEFSLYRVNSGRASVAGIAEQRLA